MHKPVNERQQCTVCFESVKPSLRVDHLINFHEQLVINSIVGSGLIAQCFGPTFAESVRNIESNFHSNNLNKREIQVVNGIASGKNNEEIALSLHLATDTIKTHVSKALKKLGVNNRAELVSVAYQRGILIVLN